MEKASFDLRSIRKSYKNADFGFCIFNSNQEIVICNKKLAQMTGLSEKAIENNPISKIFINKDSWARAAEAIEEKRTVYECSFNKQNKDETFNLRFEAYDNDYTMAYFYDTSENSRLKRELMITEKRLSIAHKAADIGSWEYDYQTGLIKASGKANEIFGELGISTDMTFENILESIKDKDRVKEEFYDFINGKKPYDTVYDIVPADGSPEKAIYSYGSIFRDSSGKPLKAVGYIKDITAWIRLENKVVYEEKLIDTYLNFVGTIIVMLDINGDVIFLNKKGSEVLGYKLEDLVGKNWVDTFIHEEFKDKIREIRIDIIEGKTDKWEKTEHLILTSSGKTKIIRWFNAAIRDESGKITGTISSGEDITDLKQKEKILQESQNSLKQAEIKAKMGHWIRNPIKNELNWSDGLYLMFGYEPNELPSTIANTMEVIHKDDRERFSVFINKAVNEGESYTIDLRGIRKSGETIYIRVEAYVEVNDDGKAASIYGIVTDITETHKRIKELEDAKERLNLSEAMSKTGHWQRDLTTNTYIFSEELYRIFGIDEGIELIRHKLLHERFHPDDRDRISDFTEEKLKKGEDYTFTGRVMKPDGSVAYIEANVQIVKDLSGKPIIARGVMKDVTELKINERKLRQSEIQLKKAEEIAGVGNWVMDLSTGRYDCSDNFYRICGFDPESTDATYKNILSATHPDDLDRINDIIQESMKTGSDYEFENRLILPDGTIRYVRSKGTYIKDDSGKPIKSVGTLFDITEYKLAEKRLVESRQRLEKAEEIAHVGHWERDLRTNKRYWSDEIYRVLGVEPQSFEASELKYREFIHPDDIETFQKNTELAKEGKIPYVIEARAIDFNGKLKYIKLRGNVVRENKKIVRTFGTFEDITEAKLREIELLEKNRMLDRAEAVTHVGHFINNYVKGTRYWSDELYRILGYEPQSEIDKATLYRKLMDPEDFKNTVAEMNHAIEKRKNTHEANFTINDAKGNKKYLKHLYKFQYENDEHVASFGVVQDITEVKTHYEDMEYMNYHDSLTDLYNRRYFDEVFSEIDIKQNYPLALIVADINGLKMTNDTIGHSAGDRLIMKTARILRSVCEEGDVLARIGGDDFILLMPATTQSQAEILMNELHELFTKANEEISISVSMGLSVKVKADTKKEDFIKEAEDNMYTSKLYEKASKRGDMLQLIMDTLYERSSREEKHSERVSKYCEEMAKALKLPKHKINELTALGLLHDIGKIAIKDSVLNKPDKLDDEEWLEIKRHSETGYRILSQSPGMLQASKYVLAHHERWDGKGYPQGLKSYEIPMQARIISICDAFDAMRSKRPYRDPMPLEDAVKQIKEGAGSQFDPELAKVFVVQVLEHSW